MKRDKLLIAVTFGLLLTGTASAAPGTRTYSGKELDHIAFPIGGLGSGMFCIEGTGAISNVSFHHYPQMFNEPCTFAALHLKGVENGTKVLEANVPSYKIFGRRDGGMGVGGTTWGLPRFDDATFTSEFPFATINLKDKDMPVVVSITGWNPFIPNDEDNSGLPVGGLEYSFKTHPAQWWKGSSLSTQRTL